MVTNAPTWTILIPTIGQRDVLFRRLLARLLPQLDEHEGRVRVLGYWNNGYPSLGEIRDELVAAAQTEYVSFVDDDDLPAETFVADCVAAMETRPDKVGFKVGYYVDGKLQEIADQSIRHKTWYRSSAGELCRDITHIGPIRTEIASRGHFRRAAAGKAEDRVWVKQVRPFVATEVYVDKVLYDYLWSHKASAWQRPDRIAQVGKRPEIDHAHFAWLDGRQPEVQTTAHRAGIYRPTLRSGAWEKLLPFVIDVEASYDTFSREGAGGYKQEYAGLGVWKSDHDMDRYRKIIEATHPEVIVETGTRWGGFAAWLVGEFGVEVITVDMDVDTRPDEWLGVTFVTGDSKDPEVVAEVVKHVAGRRTMVSLDADHHAPHVALEIAAYAPLVSHGCYLVVEDGLADLVTSRRARRFAQNCPTTGGPLVAIAATLAGDQRFERDRETEQASPITHHPAGWWLRR